jgi:hypothetical protein
MPIAGAQTSDWLNVKEMSRPKREDVQQGRKDALEYALSREVNIIIVSYEFIHKLAASH